MPDLTTLHEDRKRLIAEGRAVLEKAKQEGREPSAEERANFDKAMDDAEAAKGQIEQIQGDEARQRRLDLAEAESGTSKGRKTTPPPAPGTPSPSVSGTQLHPKIAERLAIRAYKREQWAKRHGPADTFRRTPEYHALFRAFCQGDIRPEHRKTEAEARSLQLDVDTAAGYLVPPVQWSNDLIQFVNDMVFLRGLATTVTVTDAKSLGVPSLETDAADADWTSELLTGSEETSLAFGKRDLTPHPMAKNIKLSRTLLRYAPRAENIVKERLGYKVGITEEKVFMTGVGGQQPLGLFTASASGISTARDVAAASTTTVVGDDLINAKYTLKAQYQNSPTTRWVFSRTLVKNLRKLKDGTGQYLWAPGLTAGQPDTVLDTPYVQSEYCPATFTTGLYVALIGDMRNYWIADALGTTLQRLDELYAATNQVGFILRKELDGMPVLEEAFVRLKLA